MKKKTYESPRMKVQLIQSWQPLLAGSYDGAANAPEVTVEKTWDPEWTDEP